MRLTRRLQELAPIYYDIDSWDGQKDVKLALKGVADKMRLQVDHLITELEGELERMKKIRHLSQMESTDESLPWHLYLEWIDSKGEFHKKSLNYPLSLLCSTLGISYHPDMSVAELKAEILLKLRSEKCKKVQSSVACWSCESAICCL